MMGFFTSLSGLAVPAILAVSLVAALALGMERLFRHAAPPLRVTLLQVALVKFTVPGLGLTLLPTWGAFADVSRLASMPASPWWAVALAIWMGGVLIALSRTVGAALAVGRLVGAAAPADAVAVARLAALATKVGVGAPRLRTSTHVAAPFVCGSMRPTIVLPATWSARFARGDWDGVLLHELAHVKRRDLFWMELASLLAIVWWWHPLLHLVTARASAAQEDACDDLAVSTSRGDADDYSEALVAAAALAARAETPAFSAGLGARRIERRLRRLADPRRPTTRVTRAHLAAVLALALAAALAPGHGSGMRASAVDGAMASDPLNDAHHHRHSHHRHP